MGLPGSRGVNGDGGDAGLYPGNRLDLQTGMPTDWLGSTGQDLPLDFATVFPEVESRISP